MQKDSEEANRLAAVLKALGIVRACIVDDEFAPQLADAFGASLAAVQAGKVADVKGVRPEPSASPGADACPQCGKGRLVRRQARRGRNAGSFFLGCDKFPECRYIRSL